MREQSYNTALLKAFAVVSPKDIEIVLFEGLGRLPLFNPDIDPMDFSEVSKLKQDIAKCDGLLIASPEYAHGISGALKNLLDWLVGGEEFVNKPVALLNASTRAYHAYQALHQVISTMNGLIVEEASISVSLLGSSLDEKGILENIAIVGQLKNALDSFKKQIQLTEIKI